MLRWWDRWLKGIDTGVMDEPMLTTWITDSVEPADHHEALPGRWIEEPCWPPPDRTTHRLFPTDDGLSAREMPLAPRPVSTPRTVGRHAGEWCPFGGNDQREDDARSFTFETAPIDRAIELLGAPVLDVELTSDKPVARLVAWLCDVHPTGKSLRVSYGTLSLAHCDSDGEPTPLLPGRRYRVRLQLNDAGSVFPAGHEIRLALSTTYWPLLWPSPETATLTIHGGTIELPLRPPRGAETERRFANPETAPPDKVTTVAPGVKRIDRLGLELGTHGQSNWHIDDDDPTSATAELRYTDTMARGDWNIRIETSLRLSCTRDDFLLQASLRACEGDDEICIRTWNRRIPRDCL